MILAQASTTSVLLSVAALIVLILVGGIVAVWVRRRWRAEPEGAGHESLSLDQLRRLHAQGTITDEELKALKQLAVRAHTIAPGPAPERPVPAPGDRLAKPGFDLTGEPLPGAPDAGMESLPGENKSGPDEGPDPGA